MSKGSREATESAEGAALRMGAAERHSPHSFLDFPPNLSYNDI